MAEPRTLPVIVCSTPLAVRTPAADGSPARGPSGPYATIRLRRPNTAIQVAGGGSGEAGGR